MERRDLNLGLLLDFLYEKENTTSLRNEIALLLVQQAGTINNRLPVIEELAIKRGFISRDLKGLKLVGVGPFIEDENASYFRSASTRNRDCDHTENAYFCSGCGYWAIGNPFEHARKDGRKYVPIHWCEICGDKIWRKIT